MRPTTAAPLVPCSHNPERRQWYRYPSGPEIYCRLVIDGVVDFWAVRVHNLSTGGIKLMLDIPMPRDKVVTVVLHNPARKYSCQRQLRVAYSHKIGKNQFISGGGFVKALNADEMQGLL